MLETIKNWLKPMRTCAISSSAAAIILAASFFAGCGEVQINERPGITGFHYTITNGKDSVLIEQENGGEITYTMNGKKVSRDQVPEEFLKRFNADGNGNSEELSLPFKSK